jgi:NosR/NirI family nitrous oxide reductase transcriptional regulator
LNAAVSKDRLKRKLRHLCRFLALVAIVWLIHKSHQDFLVERGDRGHPIELSDAQLYLPTVTSLEPDPDDPAFLQALDANGTELGLVSQTSPTGDSAIGFSGSTNLLVVWDRKDRVSSVSIRSSGDTKDHVDAILEDPNFFRQFEGKSMDDLAQGEEINAVSGATLTSLAIADALSIRFGGTAKASRFPDQIRVKELTPYFPTCAKLRPSRTHTSLFEVLDENGSMLGQVGRTSPHADKIIGYQGPIDVLLILENNGTLKAMQMRSSFENPPYADYPNDDYYLPSLFEGRSIPQLAEMNETAERYEGVSGATMTSRAMAKGIVETARQLELERIRAERKKPWVVWDIGETGSLGVILLAGFVAFTKRGKTKFFRRSLQVLLVCYLGLVNGDILSQALFAGWAQNGVPWERAPILVLLTLAALLVPMATGKSFYCHQLCPHGAAQQWMRKLRKSPLRLPAKLGKALELIPFILLFVVLFVAITSSTFPLANLEPFDGYVWEVAGVIAIAILLIGLAVSAFIPMAYCRYGCPTGALLKLFEFKQGGDGWSKRDYFSFALLGAALLLYYFS